MLYFALRMPVVFVIARDWTLRAGVRAELREISVDALGMENADDAGRALGAGHMPSVVVLEATAGLADDPAIRQLVQRVPTVLIASRTETVELPRVAAVLYRPVSVGEVVREVRKVLERGHSA